MNGATPSGPSALIAATTMPAVDPEAPDRHPAERLGGALEQTLRQ